MSVIIPNFWSAIFYFLKNDVALFQVPGAKHSLRHLNWDQNNLIPNPKHNPYWNRHHPAHIQTMPKVTTEQDQPHHHSLRFTFLAVFFPVVCLSQLYFPTRRTRMRFQPHSTQSTLRNDESNRTLTQSLRYSSSTTTQHHRSWVSPPPLS